MTLDDFAAMTRRIIARDGFDGFLPTACFPARRNIAVLAGIPDGVDVELAAIEWAVEKSDGEEVLVALKVSPSTFKVVRRYENQSEDATYSVTQE